MGFKCPLCNKDFGNQKKDFDTHIKQCNSGLAEDFVNAVKKTCERREGENGSMAGYRVKVTADVLNVRKGPGTNYGIKTQVKEGEVYTIVGEEKNGSTTWGKLKSGEGYISLGYTKRM